MGGIPLRRRLMVLAVAGTLPLAVAAAVGLFVLKQQQDAQTRQVGVELARSIANGVDAEVRSMVAVLETLATTPSLDTGDLEVFRARAGRVLQTRPEWSAIRLADPTGRTLSLDGTRVSDEGLKHLGALKQLWSLDVGGSHVGDPGVGHLARVNAYY